MASSRKSLSDFFGLSWSTWSEYTGELTNSDGDEEDNRNDSRRKSSDVMRLYSSDMQKFGLFPETDCFCTVVCSECNALVKPQGLLNHMRVRHKELVPGKIAPEKIFKLSDSSSIKISGEKEKPSAKHVLNEKLLSKLVLNEKHLNKSPSEKLLSSPSEKHKSSLDKASSKYSNSEKPSVKNDKILGKSSSEKLSRTQSDKLKVPAEKVLGSSLLIDKIAVKSDGDKFPKSSDAHVKQADTPKPSKLSDKQPPKCVPTEKLLSKYASPESKVFPVGERHLSRSGEKISVKSVLSEKLLSKVAAGEKGHPISEKLKNVDNSMKKGDSLLKADRLVVKPVMKSLLKEKVLRNELAHTIVPGTSLLRPLVQQERELPVLTGANIGLTTLSPPILTPQNLIPERHQSATDMPVLSRKRKYRERKSVPTQYDPDRHCGVWCESINKFCVRSLTCKSHSVALRRAVVGRSKPFDQLLTEHKRAKEDQRQSKEDQDDASEMSSHISDRLQSPSEPSNSSLLGSPCASPTSSQAQSPVEIVSSRIRDQDGVVSLITPSLSTSLPIPLPSYQYPPYPPDSAAESMVTLSPHLSSPLLNVALPSLSPSHAPRPPDGAEEDSQKPRTLARAVNRLQLNKGKQFNVKHTAFPPKPLRTCLFQGRKSSGMFFLQRELESMRAGFRLSVVKGNKPLPLSHSATGSDFVTSHSAHVVNEPSSGLNTSSQVTGQSNFKSVLSTMCSPKTVLSRDGQQRVQRTHKAVTNGPEAVLQSATADASIAISSDKLPQGMRISVPTPTTIPQQIAYLTTSTPVTFQQVPIINSQVLSQLQLQSKGAGGTLKLLSTGGGGRTLLVHQYQDGSGAES